MKHPHEIVWVYGDLPPVESVDYNCTALIFAVDKKSGELVFIETVMPYKDKLNPLRWCTAGGYPIHGYFFDGSYIKAHAWLRKNK